MHFRKYVLFSVGLLADQFLTNHKNIWISYGINYTRHYRTKTGLLYLHIKYIIQGNRFSKSLSNGQHIIQLRRPTPYSLSYNKNLAVCSHLKCVCLFIEVLTSPFVTVMDISATDRNPEPGDDPLLFSTDSKGSFRCTQPHTVMHTTKPLLNQLGTTGICPHRSNQPTQDSNPGPSDHESLTLCVSPSSEDVT